MFPKKIELDFFYLCPNCQCGYWANYGEIQKIGKMFCEECSTVLLLDPIDEIKIRFTNGKTFQKKGLHQGSVSPTKKDKPRKEEVQIDLSEHQELVDLFIQLGWTKGAAKKVVENGVKNGLDTSKPDKFIQGVLSFASTINAE